MAAIVPMRCATICAKTLRRSLRHFGALPVTRTELFINNEWVKTDRTTAILNPATGNKYMDAAMATTAHVDDAIKAARARLNSKDWGKNTTGKQRATLLRKMAAELTAQREEFATLETIDNGKPLEEGRGDIDACIGILQYFAGLAEKLDEKGPHGGTVPLTVSDDAVNAVLRKEPYGVIGMVTPWNYPLMQAVVKVAPAIAAGCTMVLKPAGICPATCLRFGEIAIAAGLPAGVLNVVNGTGRTVGQYMIEHKGLDRISFTGSGPVGQQILAAAGQRLIPASVELGGKGALIVFDDVDIDTTVDWIMCGIFMSSGQICSATSRLVLQETIYDKLMERLVEETKKIKLGDGLEEGVTMGPLVSQSAFDTVKGFVDRAKAEGATVAAGGQPAPAAGSGYFYEPTILTDLNEDSEAWMEEIFGPVLAVCKFKTEDEAVRIANNSPYGLSAGVCSVNEERATRVAEQLDAGVVFKNCSNVVPTEVPFGGFKESGFGKEFGEMGLEEYLKVKSIVGVQPKYSWEWYVKKN